MSRAARRGEILPGQEIGVKEHKSYVITGKSVRFRTHRDRFVEVDEHSHAVAWNGHGPYVTVKIFDDATTPMPRAGVVLEPSQARAIALELLARVEKIERGDGVEEMAPSVSGVPS